MKESPGIQNKQPAVTVEQRKVSPIIIDDDEVKSKSGIVTLFIAKLFLQKICTPYIVHLAYSPSTTIDIIVFASVYKEQWLNDKV